MRLALWNCDTKGAQKLYIYIKKLIEMGTQIRRYVHIKYVFLQTISIFVRHKHNFFSQNPFFMKSCCWSCWKLRIKNTGLYLPLISALFKISFKQECLCFQKFSNDSINHLITLQFLGVFLNRCIPQLVKNTFFVDNWVRLTSCYHCLFVLVHYCLHFLQFQLENKLLLINS